LFPVFAKAREKARQTSCVSNLKQLGATSQMYMQDWEETFPPFRTGQGLIAQIEPYLPKKYSNNQYSFSDLWICPSKKSRNTPTYSANAAISSSGKVWGTYSITSRLADIPNPADIICMAEGNYYSAASLKDNISWDNTNKRWETWVFGPPWNLTIQGVCLRHFDRTNAVMMDGHVQTFDEGALKNSKVWAWK
jgi:prepilin-type processing-associated H-X9-DG protein